MIKKYLYLLAACLLVVLVVGYLYYRSHNVTKLPAVSAITVEVIKVKKATLPRQITAVGTTIAEDYAKLSPEISGVVAKFYADNGQRVQINQPIIQLDDSIYRTELKAAEAGLAFSNQHYQRIEKLAKSGGESKQDLDNALTELQLKQADLAVKKSQLSKMLIKAPFNGILGAKKVSIGEYVAVGEELIDIVNKQNLKVKYSVPERYLSQLKLDQPVTFISSSYPNQVFVGKLSFIAPSIDIDSGTVLLEATLANSAELLVPGLFVQVLHNLGNKQQALVLPQACLVPTFEGFSVYRVINSKVVATPVTIGTRLLNWVEITHGLQVGDSVILAGQQKVKEGSLVTSVMKGEQLELN